MLGDDHEVFDLLSEEMKPLAWGHDKPPSSMYHKDIVCADLVSVCLRAAAVNFWPSSSVYDPTGRGYTSPHAANYYRPNPPYVDEVPDGERWRPGDVIIYGWRPETEDRVYHVNLYVGPFSGTDVSGRTHAEAQGYEVINASLDHLSDEGAELGTAVTPLTRDHCRTYRCGYNWWKRVRVSELSDAYQSRPTMREFAQIRGDQFVLGGAPFQFVGVNVRGLVHYGDREMLSASHVDDREIQLAEARSVGARVARVFLASNQRTPEEIGDRLSEALELAAQYEILLIVAFTNLYGDNPFWTMGDAQFYTRRAQFEGSWTDLLDRDFFAEGYRSNYMPLVEHIVRRFQDNPWVFAWELGNELKYEPEPEVFMRFGRSVAKRIWEIDPLHMLTTGMISTRDGGLNVEQGERLYDLPYIHFLTVHTYDGEDEDDSSIARVLGKPFVVEEVGFSQGDRPARTRTAMDRWFGRGTSGYMQWGFMATSGDIGDGDERYGMDRVWHEYDWEELREVYIERAASL